MGLFQRLAPIGESQKRSQIQRVLQRQRRAVAALAAGDERDEARGGQRSARMDQSCERNAFELRSGFGPARNAVDVDDKLRLRHLSQLLKCPGQWPFEETRNRNGPRLVGAKRSFLTHYRPLSRRDELLIRRQLDLAHAGGPAVTRSTD